jgi:hypothetical protein
VSGPPGFTAAKLNGTGVAGRTLDLSGQPRIKIGA